MATEKINYPLDPTYWAERQLLCEITLLRVMTVLAGSLPKSEVPKIQDVLNIYQTRQKQLLEHYENKTIK